MPYPESFIGPMREELTRLGVKELRTAEDVDAAVRGTAGTLMVVVNSMCGCAAGRARPGVALALQHHVKPDVVATVFAGGDIEATERARSYFAPYRPSSPSIALLRDGQIGVHAGAAPDREPERRSHRARPDRRVRQVLRSRRPLVRVRYSSRLRQLSAIGTTGAGKSRQVDGEDAALVQAGCVSRSGHGWLRRPIG